MRSRDAIDLVETNRRKSRSLLELSRAARSLQASPDHAIRNQLQRVRVKLQQNYDLLGLYLAAAQEVTDILGDALRDAESDGTYSAALGSGHGSR
nr:flagellar protein FlgN [Prosthecomicrobium pneumaticum]